MKSIAQASPRFQVCSGAPRGVRTTCLSFAPANRKPFQAIRDRIEPLHALMIHAADLALEDQV